MKREEIQKIILIEMEKLRSIMESTPDKVIEIINEFNDQTPVLLLDISKAIKQNQNKEVAALLHKVKVRYSYLGFEEIYDKMQTWEHTIKAANEVEDILEELKQIEDTTLIIIDVLKKIDIMNLSTNVENPHPLYGKTVLVAEDDEINAMVFEAYIQELGGEILMAHDGFEAINQVAERSPDLIFMDVHMPYCSGLDAIKTLRSRGVTTPIISLSASSRLNEKDESLQAGANDFITKPANRTAIRQALLKHIV